MKTFYFFAGLPRSGNTIFSAILNENPDIYATGHSCVPEIFYAITEAQKKAVVFTNYLDVPSLNNVYKNIIKNYYAGYKERYIVERGDWITPYNLKILKQFCPNPIKGIILVRDILDILKSYLQLCKYNPNYIYNEVYGKMDLTTLYTSEIETKADLIMAKGDYVDTMLYSIHQLKLNNLLKDFLIINYDDLVTQTKETIEKVYDYYGIKKFNHKFTNLKQLPLYHDEILGAPLHHIRTDKVKKSINNIKLPETVVNKYKPLNRIWNE